MLTALKACNSIAAGNATRTSQLMIATHRCVAALPAHRNDSNLFLKSDEADHHADKTDEESMAMAPIRDAGSEPRDIRVGAAGMATQRWPAWSRRLLSSPKQIQKHCYPSQAD